MAANLNRPNQRYYLESPKPHSVLNDVTRYLSLSGVLINERSTIGAKAKTNERRNSPQAYKS